MAAVVVAGRRPLYEMGAADLVVKQLNELSLVSLKQLFRTEDLVERQVCAMAHSFKPSKLHIYGPIVAVSTSVLVLKHGMRAVMLEVMTITTAPRTEPDANC